MTSIPQIFGKLSSWASGQRAAFRGIFTCSHPRIDPCTLGMPEPAVQPCQTTANGITGRVQMLAHGACPSLRPAPAEDPLMRIPPGELGVLVRFRTTADGELTDGHPRRIATWRATKARESTPNPASESRKPIVWLTPAVDPLVEENGSLMGMAARVRKPLRLQMRMDDLTALGRLEPLLAPAGIRHGTVARAETYLRRLPAEAHVSMPLEQLVLGCVILAEKYGTDYSLKKAHWNPLLLAASPVPDAPLDLLALERQVLEWLHHDLSEGI